MKITKKLLALILSLVLAFSVCIPCEAQEETGYEALDVEYLGFCVPTGAYLQERIYMYMGRCGKYVGTDFDRDENLSLKRYTLEELTEMIMNNEIVDAKTMAMTFKIMQKRNGK